ncbi:MAG: bifunctional tRNA (5-methylaminomethyl-2-thiouridine)(34)-methyltransferase MnmD/FAD-dependent 5-carboxymethylaminomethyl-2-thiouridine(34) oxidoreductase MnmC [Oceanisphaera sp.]
MSPHFITTARLDWNSQGTPVAAAFDDVYFYSGQGLAESRYVFIEQNNLVHRWLQHDSPLFVVAETGFGTGLNMLATWHAFIHYRQQHPKGNTQRLHLISVEKFPLTHYDLQQALSQWPELSTLSERLLAQYPVAVNGCHRLWLDDNVSLDLWLGDVAQVLPNMEAGLAGKVDTWYLDGFAPSKNPEMWTQDLFENIARLTRNGATLSTFTAAGFVRRGLTEAGFDIQRPTGFGRKRNMITGTRRSQPRKPYSEPWFWRRPGQISTAAPENTSPLSGSPTQHTVIVGAGIAGASLAYALTRRGQSVTLIEQGAEPAMGASGNRQAAVYPLLNSEHDTLSQIYLQSFLYGRRMLSPLMKEHQVAHDWCSVVQLAFNEKSAIKVANILTPFNCDIVLPLTSDQVNQRTGINANLAGIEYPLAGWVCPLELTKALIAAAHQSGLLRCQYHTKLHSLHQQENQQWQLQVTHSTPASNKVEHSSAEPVNSLLADNVLLATGHQVRDLLQTHKLTVSSVRGQVNYQPSTPTLAGLKTVICYDGYLTPQWQGSHCVGASYAHDQEALEYQTSDEQDNLDKLNRTLPTLHDVKPSPGAGRVSVRAVCRDHLPLVGAAPHKCQQLQQYQDMPQRHKESLPLAVDYPGLYVMSALGSRGLCTAPLLAEVLVAQLLDEPYPLTREQLASLNPNRLWLRKRLKGKPVR